VKKKNVHNYSWGPALAGFVMTATVTRKATEKRKRVTEIVNSEFVFSY
jgi:hypothetical protein